MLTKTISPLLVAISLAACDSPTPPSITAAEAVAINTEADRVQELPDTAIADLPTDSVTYNGHIGGAISGDAEGSIIGDLSMDVNFDSNTIGGEVDNVNLLDDEDVPEQLLGGSLSISGSENDGLLSATATGTLTAVGEESVRGSSDVTMTLTGNVLTDTTDGDAVAGDVYGNGTGDFDINLSDGAFYGTSN